MARRISAGVYFSFGFHRVGTNPISVSRTAGIHFCASNSSMSISNLCNHSPIILEELIFASFNYLINLYMCVVHWPFFNSAFIVYFYFYYLFSIALEVYSYLMGVGCFLLSFFYLQTSSSRHKQRRTISFLQNWLNADLYLNLFRVFLGLYRKWIFIFRWFTQHSYQSLFLSFEFIVRPE